MVLLYQCCLPSNIANRVTRNRTLGSGCPPQCRSCIQPYRPYNQSLLIGGGAYIPAFRDVPRVPHTWCSLPCVRSVARSAHIPVERDVCATRRATGGGPGNPPKFPRLGDGQLSLLGRRSTVTIVTERQRPRKLSRFLCQMGECCLGTLIPS